MKTIEELEAELETVTRERDVACDDLAFILAEYANERNEELNEELNEDALCLKIAGLTHQRNEARAEVERLTDERDELLVRVADQGAELRATREAYNEARAELTRERIGIRPVDEVRSDAFRRGAEAMREACADCVKHLSHEDGLGMGSQRLEGAIRALPIPEEP